LLGSDEYWCYDWVDVLNIILCYLYVVYDLACSPLLVAILAEWILVTPSGVFMLDSWVHASILSGGVTDAWWMTSPLGNPRGGVMSIAASFPSVKKPRFYRSGEERAIRLKVMLTGLITLQQGRHLMILVDSSLANSNTEPAHNTTKYFVPNLRWGCQSHRFAWNKGYERIEWKIVEVYPLFQANRWDWQPHRKLGTKYLVVLCAGSTLPLAKQSLDEVPYKLSGAVAKLVGITF
jgi:hypothetical protein